MSSVLEELFVEKLKSTSLPMPECEVRLWEDRKQRVDFVWIEYELVVELEGGSYVHGRHHRPKGFADDCEKYNRIASEGMCLFRFTGEMVKSGLAIATLEEYFNRWHDIDSREMNESKEMDDGNTSQASENETHTRAKRNSHDAGSGS